MWILSSVSLYLYLIITKNLTHHENLENSGFVTLVIGIYLVFLKPLWFIVGDIECYKLINQKGF